MSRILSNDKRLGLLIKPLHLFLEQDVQADLHSKAMMAQDWEKSGLYYVAQLLAASTPLAFIQVHIALRENGFAPNQLVGLKNLLPRIQGDNADDSLAHYKKMVPEIYRVLGPNSVLWADMESILLPDREEAQAPLSRIFSVHFREEDLFAEDIDIALAETLFHNPKFRAQLSALMREYALRLKDSSCLSQE